MEYGALTTHLLGFQILSSSSLSYPYFRQKHSYANCLLVLVHICMGALSYAPFMQGGNAYNDYFSLLLSRCSYCGIVGIVPVRPVWRARHPRRPLLLHYYLRFIPAAKAKTGKPLPPRLPPFFSAPTAGLFQVLRCADFAGFQVARSAADSPTPMSVLRGVAESVGTVCRKSPVYDSLLRDLSPPYS